MLMSLTVQSYEVVLIWMQVLQVCLEGDALRITSEQQLNQCMHFVLQRSCLLDNPHAFCTQLVQLPHLVDYVY